VTGFLVHPGRHFVQYLPLPEVSESHLVAGRVDVLLRREVGSSVGWGRNSSASQPKSLHPIPRRVPDIAHCKAAVEVPDVVTKR